jgi:hypothetical protein
MSVLNQGQPYRVKARPSAVDELWMWKNSAPGFAHRQRAFPTPAYIHISSGTSAMLHLCFMKQSRVNLALKLTSNLKSFIVVCRELDLKGGPSLRPCGRKLLKISHDSYEISLTTPASQNPLSHQPNAPKSIKSMSGLSQAQTQMRRTAALQELR